MMNLTGFRTKLALNELLWKSTQQLDSVRWDSKFEFDLERDNRTEIRFKIELKALSQRSSQYKMHIITIPIW